jgi:uncharacterized membrane protein YdjX (TVP38/TMEM64 family)
MVSKPLGLIPMLRSLFPVLLVVLVLAVPIVPFLACGHSMEQWIDDWLRQNLPAATVAVATVVLLAVDVLLPVPSSVVCTVAAHRLGFSLGTCCSWLGMTVGAMAAFLAARLLGRVIVERLSTPEDLERADRLSRHYGPAVLVIARPIPVLAEASVLLLATTDLAWQRFMLPIALSNLGIALAYSALGHLLSLPLAIASSIALPLLATLIASKLWPRP